MQDAVTFREQVYYAIYLLAQYGLSVGMSEAGKRLSEIMRTRLVNTFWVGLTAILLLAGMLRFLSFQFSLPYVEHIDEPAYYLGGQEWRGLYNSQGYYAGIPPAYVAVNAVAQPVLESLGVTGLAATVGVLRGAAVIADLLTLVCIALTVRLAGGELAALVAAAAWGVAPLVLENGVYALPDPFIYLFTSLALYLAAMSCIGPARHGWCVGSVAAGLAAVLMKYPALPALLPGVLAAAWLTHRQKRHWRWLLVQIVLIAMTAGWLILVYGVDFNNLQREGATVQSEGVRNLFDVSRVINNLFYVFVPLQPVMWFLIVGLGVLAYIYARQHKLSVVKMPVIVLAGVLIFSTGWLTSSYSQVDIDKIRYVLPATAAACVVLGLAAQQIITVVQQMRGACYAGALVIVSLVVLVWLPQLQVDVQLVQERRLPDRRVALRQWFDSNLEPGTVIVNAANHKTFNPLWGGIAARQWVDWWASDNLMEYTVDEWRTQRGMAYVVLSPAQVADMQERPEGQAYLGELLHLRDFDEAGWRGPEMLFYRLWRMQVETHIQFGDAIVLVGYDQSTTQVRAGEAVTLRFYWQASSTPFDNYSLFVHVTKAGEVQPLAQADGAPAAEERPTLTWNYPSETLISSPVVITLPPDLPTGEYQIRIGLYNYASGVRLPIRDGERDTSGDAHNLSTIEIIP